MSQSFWDDYCPESEKEIPLYLGSNKELKYRGFVVSDEILVRIYLRIHTIRQRIAFTSRRDGNEEIYVMNADGTEQTNLTNNSAADA
jgi:hypothetical protein